MDISPQANNVAGTAGVQLCAAVFFHSCRNALKTAKTCYIVFLPVPSHWPYSRTQFHNPLVIEEILTPISLQILNYTFNKSRSVHAFTSVYVSELPPSKTKHSFFFHIPLLLRKYSIILLAWECKCSFLSHTRKF